MVSLTQSPSASIPLPTGQILALLGRSEDCGAVESLATVAPTNYLARPLRVTGSAPQAGLEGAVSALVPGLANSL